MSFNLGTEVVGSSNFIGVRVGVSVEVIMISTRISTQTPKQEFFV